jgi:hypothetical protein
MKDKKHEGRKVLKRAWAARKKDAPVRSERALAAHGNPGMIGKPFKPGEDSRRHKLGRMSLDRAAFAAQLNNFLCNGAGSPEALAGVLWKYALRGQAWAVCELLDRVAGKITQPIHIAELAQKYRIVYADGTPAGGPFYGPGFIDPTDEEAERVLAMGRKTGDPDGR